MDPEKKKNKYNSIYIIFGLIFLFIIFAMNIWFLNSLNNRNPRGTIPPYTIPPLPTEKLPFPAELN